MLIFDSHTRRHTLKVPKVRVCPLELIKQNSEKLNTDKNPVQVKSFFFL